MSRRLTILLFVWSSSLFAQDNPRITLNFTDTPVSDILVHVRDEYGALLSFDHQGLSSHRLTINKTFPDIESLLSKILEDLPFSLEKRGDIYIIYDTPAELTRHRLKVTVTDAGNGEILPFAHVMVNGNAFTTDYVGMFSSSAYGSDTFQLKVSYVGYYVVDTLLHAGSHILSMQPATVNLKEVVVEGVAVDRYSETGSETGVIRLNQKIAGFLPGNGDNSIFNFLRLQPGILAAGEQAGDIVIWGSYQGHSKIEFDGYTLFGLKNFAENISSINPFAVKDIQVLKSAYGSEEEGRVGGIVRIIGYEGQKDRAVAKLNLNNQTISAFASIPLFQKSAISISSRSSYRDFISSSNIDISQEPSRGRKVLRTDGAISPEYLYRDYNIKWAGTNGGDRFHISYFRATDEFSFAVDDEFGPNKVEVSTLENNQQWAGSLFYNKSWENGSQTKLLIATSNMNIDRIDSSLVDFRGNPQNNFDAERSESTSLSETKAHLSHLVYWRVANSFKAGLQYVDNQLQRQLNFQGNIIEDKSDGLSRMGYYAENEWTRNKWKIRAGGRIDHLIESNELFLQPRLALAWGTVDNFRISIAWGKYNQFIHRNAIIDAPGNLRYIWDLSEGLVNPIESNHAVLGVSGFVGNFSWRINAFNKITSGMSRYLEDETGNLSIYEGDSRVSGLDFYVSREFGGHRFWTSYTLSDAQEYFGYFDNSEYQRALQDQRHELKSALLMDFEPFFLSMNYVYGSGLPDPSSVSGDVPSVYSRFDLSGRIRIRESRPYIETGINLLNLFNTQNIKFNNVIRLPESEFSNISIHAESIPFTITLHAKLIF